jgi:hypothetical protein
MRFEMRRKLPGGLAMLRGLALFLILVSAFPLNSTQKKALEDMSLEELLSVDVLPARVESPWKMTIMLTLRIYGENLNLPQQKQRFRLATDSNKLLEEFNIRDFLIKGKEVEAVLISKKDKNYADFDLAFVKSKKLAKKIAAHRNILIFSDKKSCSPAAFVIAVIDRKFTIIARKENIEAQGARYSPQFLSEAIKVKH